MDIYPILFYKTDLDKIHKPAILKTDRNIFIDYFQRDFSRLETCQRVNSRVHPRFLKTSDHLTKGVVLNTDQPKMVTFFLTVTINLK